MPRDAHACGVDDSATGGSTSERLDRQAGNVISVLRQMFAAKPLTPKTLKAGMSVHRIVDGRAGVVLETEDESVLVDFTANGQGSVKWVPCASLESVRRTLYGKHVPNWAHVFRVIDTDGSGQVDLVELSRAFRRLGLGLTQSQAKQLFDAVDTDRRGWISYAEFHEHVFSDTSTYGGHINTDTDTTRTYDGWKETNTNYTSFKCQSWISRYLNISRNERES